MDVWLVLAGIVFTAAIISMVPRGPQQVRDYEREHALGAHRSIRPYGCTRCRA